MPKSSSPRYRSTTVLAVLRDGKGAIGSDGQVTLGDTVAKQGAIKVRSLRDGKVLAGFAGGAADALTLSEKFEGHLDRYQGHLRRATVELAREWRQDRILRRLEAMVLVMDHQDIFTVSGNGDVLEAEHGIAGVGSGAGYAVAAARGLLAHSDLDATAICRAALEIAGDICIYTNRNITVLSIDGAGDPAPRKDD
jgi:ATP-dependent HslUV protease subunit HslV